MFHIVAPRKVRVPSWDVAYFNAQWPCSPLSSERAYWFEFDEDGNLVDTDVPEHSDGPAALAMSQDALRFLMEDEQPEYAGCRCCVGSSDPTLTHDPANGCYSPP